MPYIKSYEEEENQEKLNKEIMNVDIRAENC